MNKHFRGLLAGLLLLGAFAPVAWAVTPDEMLKDPVLEGRARDISQLLRCVVCQNQSIDDSNAPLAQDLRVLVRERLTAGDTNPQAIQYIVARYGNFVLLKPPMQTNTLMLWFGPGILFGLVAFAVYRKMRPRAGVPVAEPVPELSADDEARLAKIITGSGNP